MSVTQFIDLQSCPLTEVICGQAVDIQSNQLPSNYSQEKAPPTRCTNNKDGTPVVFRLGRGLMLTSLSFTGSLPDNLGHNIGK